MKLRLSKSNSCGKLMLLVGLLIAVPLVVLPFYPEEGKYALSFIIPALGSIGLGGVVCSIGKRDDGTSPRSSSMQRSSLIVLFAWWWGFIAGAVPFVLGGVLTPLHALFESVSGWTTTGLTVIDVEATPHIFLFHRSFMQFCGGLGFALIITCVVQSRQAMTLYAAEGHPDKLMPNLKKTAQTILLIYSALLTLGTAAYRIAGMPLFDGVCHTMCALSTAGFSTQAASIGAYDSTAVEAVTIALMILGATSFAVLSLIARGQWRKALRVSELRFMFLLLLIFVPLVALSLPSGNNTSGVEGLRQVLFGMTSALTTTGFSTGNYALWPPFATGILIIAMLIGGGFGSTAGGIKITRVYILLRVTARNICRRVSGTRSVDILQYNKPGGRAVIDRPLQAETMTYIASYLSVFVVGSLLITLTAGCGLTEAMFEFSSAFGSVGLSIGITSATASAGTLIVEMLGMILGRLEIFIVLIGLYSGISAIRRRIGGKKN